tara:strand:+ start:25166 stop:28273 length:3108 start_codon:yes stop_codon:yes gene_type:complete
MNKRLNLLQAVLASSCLVVPFAGQAAFSVNAIVNDQTVVTDADDATNTITATGQINDNVAPGIDVTNKNNVIEIVTTEANFDAVQSTGAGANLPAINIQGTASNLTINNAVNRDIDATGGANDGIVVKADLTTINNSGAIGGTAGDAIIADAAGTNLTINNTATGLIGTSAAASSAISITGAAGGNGVTITNAGSDPTNANKAGIGSTISLTPAINITGSKLNSLVNTADIANLGGGAAISLDNVVGTTFTNSGEIYNDAAGVATIRFANGTSITNGFVNTGSIENNGGGSAILYAAPSAITFFQQAGTVTGDVGLNYNGAGTSLNMSGGIIDGDLTDSSAGGGIANISGGSITGDMLLNGGNQTLNFSGGTITGNLTANNANPITLNLTGGTTASIFLNNGAHILNLNGSTVQNVVGDAAANQTINLTSGSYNLINGGASGGNILNVLGSFDTTGAIANMDTVNVNAGFFNVNHVISAVNTALNVNSIMNVNANILGGGTFTNNGTTKIFSGNTVTMGGLVTNAGTLHIEAAAATPLTGVGFTNAAGSNLIVDLKPSLASPSMNTGAASAIQAGVGAVNMAGSTITANPVGEFIADGTKWDIVSGTGGIVGAQTITTPSVLLSFTDDFLAPSTYQVTATALPFSALSTNSEITNGLENALDTIISDGVPAGPMSDLLGQFQTLTSAEQVEQSLRSLVPNFNHSISTMSSMSMRRAFDDIGMHLEELQAIQPLLEEVDEYRNNEDLDGWSYGDPLLRHKSGAWIRPYAGIVDQQAIQGVDGYKGDYTGITGGMDWRILDWATVGIAGSFAKSDITQRGFIDIKQDIDSLQLTFYGKFDPFGPLYFNTLMGLARHKYSVDRTISVGTLVQNPQANYHGIQYAGQLEMGYAYFNGKYYLNPLATLKYMRLVADNYTETGTTLGLTVDNNDVSEFIGSIGLRLAMQNEYLEATYIPEITGLISYDFIGDSQETFNNFALGSPTFKSVGIKPDQTTYTLNIGLRIHTFHNSMFKVAYEFEAKDQFKAHSAMFKWYYKWY